MTHNQAHEKVFVSKSTHNQDISYGKMTYNQAHEEVIVSQSTHNRDIGNGSKLLTPHLT